MSIKLLFADDSITMQKVIQLTLENEDFHLKVAGDGNAAFEMAQSERPDIVVADISMPGMDGFELCEKLRKSSRTSEIPVILISGELEQYDDAKGDAAGAVGHITKPFKAAEFIAMVKRHAGGKEDSGTAAPSVEEILESAGADDVPSGGAKAKKPEVMELVARSKASEDQGDEDEIEIVAEDIDDLGEEAGEEETGVEEELLDAGDLLEMEEEGSGEHASKPAAEESLAEVESLAMDDDAPDVFEREVDLDVVREVAEMGATFDEGIIEEEPPAPEPHEEEAESILSGVFNSPDIQAGAREKTEAELSGKRSSPSEEEFWNKTLEDLNEEMGRSFEQPAQETRPADSIFTPPPVPGENAYKPVPPPDARFPVQEMEGVFRSALEQAVGEFIRTQAPEIFKEEMSRAIDRHVKEIFETQLERAFREEISKMIAASFQKAMPQMLGIIEKITIQITPKIAQHMIKIAIERIKKGESA